MLLPSNISYLSSVYPEKAGAIGSIHLLLCFVLGAIFISVSVTISDAIGTQWFFVSIALFNALCQMWASVINYHRVGKYSQFPSVFPEKATIAANDFSEGQNDLEEYESEIPNVIELV